MQKKLSLAKNATYNSIGIIIYCLCQWAITMVVVRLSSDYESAGILQLAISITNIFFSISCYNVRTFQISDVNNEFSTSDYVGLRFVTAFIALVLCVGYSLIYGYPQHTMFCIIAYMIFKFNETFSDVLYAVDQRHSRMDYVGISSIIRGIVLICVFTVTFKFTGNLEAAILASAAGTLLVVILFDLRKTSSLEVIKPSFSFKKITKMLTRCFPMVLSSACFTAVVTVPRQVLENMHGEEILGYYATVATPIVFIQVLATGIFNPLLSDLSESYSNNNFSKIKKSLAKTGLIILLFTIAAYIGAYFLGEFAFTLLYGESIREHTYLMYAIIACTVLYAVCWLMNGMMTLMRRMKTIAVINVSTLAISAILSKLFINRFYMNGVSYCVITSYIFFVIASFCVIVYCFSRRKKA